MPSNAAALRRILVRIGGPRRQPGFLHQAHAFCPHDHHCKWQHTAADGSIPGGDRTSYPSPQLPNTYGRKVRADEPGRRCDPAPPFDGRIGPGLPRQFGQGSDRSGRSGDNAHPTGGGRDGQSNGLEARNAPDRQQQRALVENEGTASNSPTTSESPKFRIVESSDRRPQLEDPEAFAAVIESAGKRETDGGGDRRLKARQDLKPKYFEAYAREELMRKRKSTTRIEKLWDRQGPRSRDVQGVLKVLEENTPAGVEHYLKRSETFRLPDGARARFDCNPDERILEIMQRTGSHVQLSSDEAGGNNTAIGSATKAGFNALTLRGSPKENADALRLLPSFVQVVVEDDLNASKNLADYKLQSADILPRHLLGHTDDPADAPWIEEHSGTDLDMQLQRAIDSVTPPVRAVWDRPSETSALGASERKTVDSPGLAVTEHIRRLTAPQPRLKSRQRLVAPARDSTDSPLVGTTTKILDLIRKTPNIPSEALTLALEFLTHNSLLPQLRQALDNAIRMSPGAVTPANYDRILASCARSQSIVDYGHILSIMLRQKHQPTAETWMHFHGLVALRFPTSTPLIEDKMREKGILADPHAQIKIIRNTIEHRFTTFLDATSNNQNASDNDITAFIARLDLQHPGIHWLTLSTANRLLKVLLARGHRDQALHLLSLFPSRHLKAKTDTLNTFLTSAYRDHDLAGFLTILHHFDRQQTDPLPFDAVTWSLLFKLAWSRRSWNVCRVAWRYAVMSGLVKYEIQNRVQQSLTCPLPEVAGLEGEARAGDQARRELFNSLAGKFVVGIADGLKRGASGPETDRAVAAMQAKALELATASRKGRKSLKESLQRDIAEVESLRPKVPVLTKLEEAFEKDLRWKQRGLGLPGGLRQGGRYEGMAAREGGILGEVLLHGIKVPVAVGDGTQGFKVGPMAVWTGNSVGGGEFGDRYAREAGDGGTETWQAGSWADLKLRLDGSEREGGGTGDAGEAV